jgi:hypothetical protein
VTRLLEQPVPLRLRLAQLLGRVTVRVGEQLARLVARVVQDLGTLSLALLPVPLDLGFPVLHLAAAAANLFLRLGELRLGGALRVGFDRVGELGGGADQMQRVHPDRVARRLDGLAAPTRRLQHAQLRLQLRRVAAERLERLADRVGVVPLALLGQVLEPRERGQ